MKTLIITSSLSPESRSFILCTKTYEKLIEKGKEVEMIDAREMDLIPCHNTPSESMNLLS